MQCSRCKGRLVKDRMFDLPRKILEYFCINCGERFWQERCCDSNPGLMPAEIRPARFEPKSRGDWLVVGSN